MAVSIRCGQLCKDCVAGKCVDEPSEREPVRIECNRCNGGGCQACDKNGWWLLTSCPQQLIDGDMCDLLNLADLYEKGLPPIAGGALDQSKAFTDSCHLIWHDVAQFKNEKGVL